ncbi:hypothetical protein GCM10020216_047530 [Nonomuraea helvata]
MTVAWAGTGALTHAVAATATAAAARTRAGFDMDPPRFGFRVFPANRGTRARATKRAAVLAGADGRRKYADNLIDDLPDARDDGGL